MCRKGNLGKARAPSGSGFENRPMVSTAPGSRSVERAFCVLSGFAVGGPPLLDSAWIAGASLSDASRRVDEMPPMRKPQAIGLVRTVALTAPIVLSLALPGPAAAVEQKLIASDGAADERFGRSVAIEGNTAFIGAPSADGAHGAVYVFQRTGKGWTRTAKLTASDGAAGDFLGSSIAVDGDAVVAGASADDVGAKGSLQPSLRRAGLGLPLRARVRPCAARPRS